jgi:hypothetical protein
MKQWWTKGKLILLLYRNNFNSVFPLITSLYFNMEATRWARNFRGLGDQSVISWLFAIFPIFLEIFHFFWLDYLINCNFEWKTIEFVQENTIKFGRIHPYLSMCARGKKLEKDSVASNYASTNHNVQFAEGKTIEISHRAVFPRRGNSSYHRIRNRRNQ